jgi:hypothetical protein
MIKKSNEKMIGHIEDQSNIDIIIIIIKIIIYTSCHSIRKAMIEMKDTNPYRDDNNARDIRKRTSNIKIIKISKFQSFKYYKFRNMVEFGKDRAKGRVSMIISHGLLSMLSEFKLNSERVLPNNHINRGGLKRLYTGPHSITSLSRPKAGGRGPLTIEPRTEGYIWQTKTTTKRMEPATRTPRSMLKT